MSDVKGLIERLRGDIFDAVPDDNDMQNVLSVAADALESEHAEVERLNGALRATDDFRIADWQKLEAERDDAEGEVERLRERSKNHYDNAIKWRERAERAEAKISEYESAQLPPIIQGDRAIRAWRRIITENARLTAQLLTVREANDWARSEERTTTDWALDSDARRSEILTKLGNRLDAILDAATDGATDE